MGFGPGSSAVPELVTPLDCGVCAALFHLSVGKKQHELSKRIALNVLLD
jgi:hypothetical protein